MANNSYKNSISLGIRLQPTSEIQNELNNVIKQLEKNSNIKIKIDDKSFNLTNLNKQLSDIQKQLIQTFNFDKVSKSAYDSAKIFETKIDSLGEKIGKLHQKSDLRITTKEGLQEAKEVNSALEEQYKLEQQMANIRSKTDYNNRQRELKEQEQETKYINKALEQQYQEQLKINNLKDNLQSKLNIANNNSFINPTVINELQNKLNGINTNTAEKEIKELQQTINNLSSSDSQIVRLQNTISKMENNLTNMKGKYGSLVGDSSSKAQLDSYTSQVEKLKNVLNSLQNGGTISGQKLASELNLGTNASRELSTAVKNSASALKLATTDSESFGQSIRRALSNTGIYMGTYQVINTITNALKDGIKTIIDIDTQMRDLAKVSSATTEQLSKFSGVANKIAIDVGTSTEAVISATTYYSKLGYSIDEASKRAEKATIFANVADMNIDDASKALITIQKGFNLNSLEDMNRVMDVANAIGNNYSSTSQNVAEGLRRMGNAMKEAGNSYEQSVGLFVAGNASVQDAEVVGNAIKTITMRLRGMKTEIDDTGIPASKLRQAIKDITATTGQEIDIMKDNNTYKSTYDQMTELAKVYPKLSDAQRSYLQYVIAGQRQGNIFSGMMANMKEGTDAYTTALNSSGSAMREQQIFMDSIEGKLNKLKETFKQFWVATISSSSVKNTVDVLTKLVSTFGNLPTIIALATTAFLVFKGQAIMGAIDGLIQYATTLTSVISRVGLAKVAMGELSIAMATNPFGLLAVGITTAIVALDLFGTSSEQAKQKNDELLNSIKQSKDDITSLEQLKTQFENLKQELDSGNLSTEQAKQKKEELSGVYQKLIQQAPELQGLLNGETGSYQNQSKAIQNIIDLKKQEMALKSEKYFDDNSVSDKSLQQKIDQMKQYQKMMESNAKYATMSDEELKNNNALGWSSGDTVREQNKHSELLNKQKLMDLNQELQTIMTNYNTLNSLGLKSPISNDMIQKIKEVSSSLNVYGNDIKNNTNKINENTDAKDKNNQVLSTADQEAQVEQQKAQAVSKATEEYQKSTQAIAKAQGFIDKLNKSQAVTPQLAGQISKTYGDITTQINSYGSTIDFLKGKIQEQQEAQQNSLMVLKGEDSQYYQDCIANNEDYENQINDFLSRFTNNSDQAYQVDLSQYTTLNEMKKGVQSSLKTAVDGFMKDFVDINSSGYKVDYENFQTLIGAKREFLKQFLGEMSGVLYDLDSNSFTESAYGGVDLSGSQSDETYKRYEDKAKGVLKQQGIIQDALKKLDGAYKGGGLNFKGFDGGGGTSDFSGTGKDKSASDAKKAEEELKKNEKKMIDDITDAYNKAKDIISNDIEEINAKITELGDADDSNFTQRVSLTSQKIDEQKKIVEKAQEQLNALKNVTVTTAEAQEALETATLKASKELRNETLEVSKLQSEIEKADIEELKKIFEDQKEIAEATLDSQQKKQTQDLENIKTQQEELHQTKMDNYEAELKALDEQSEKLDEENSQVERQNELQKEQNDLKQKEIDLERLKNQKTIQTYTKDANGNWNFTYTYDKKAVADKQKEVDEAQSTLDETNRKNTLEDSKKEIENQKKQIEELKTAEDKAYEEKKKYLDKYSEDLKEAQDRDKKRIEANYSDIEKLAKDTLKSLEEEHNKDWNSIADSISIRITQITKQLNDLKTLQANYTTTEIDEAINSGDISGFLEKNKNKLNQTAETNISDINKHLNEIDATAKDTKVSIDDLTDSYINLSSAKKDNDITDEDIDSRKINVSKITTIDFDGLSKQLENLKDVNSKIKSELDSFYSDKLNKQNQAQNEELASLNKFSQEYLLFTDKFLELLQLVYDFRFNNVIINVSGAVNQIIEGLKVIAEAYAEYASAWNTMHPDDEIPSSIDMSGVNSANMNYQKSVSDYQTNKLSLYTSDAFEKYASQIGDGISKNLLGKLNNYASSIGVSSNSSTINNKSTSSVSTTNVNINQLDVNTKDAQNLLNQLLTIVKNKTSLS